MRSFFEILKGFLFGSVICAVLIAGLSILLPTASDTARDRLTLQMQGDDEEQSDITANRLRMPLPRPVSSYTSPYIEEDQGQLTYSGGLRDVHVLDFGSGDVPRPTIVLFHGAQRSGLSMLDMWKGVARSEGLLLIAPDAISGTWTTILEDNIDVEQILDAIAEDFPIDRDRIFMFGHSAGGRHVLNLVNHFEGPWRAAAVHGGSMRVDRVRPVVQATPLRIYLGTEDESFPLAGVEETADTLARAGHPMDLVTITGHTHWYYNIGPAISRRAWRYFADQ